MNENRYTPEELWLLREKYHNSASPAFEADRTRLHAGEPLAYIIGSIPFLGATIELSSRPLIPRPETEWWVAECIRTQTQPPKRILDLCAGSGAIGIALAQAFSEAELISSDSEERHIKTIEQNYARNHVQGTAIQSDLFANITGTFDLIVTNPPYISDERMDILPESVSTYEPEEALRGGVDGLDLVRRIIRELPHHLTSNGEVWMEIDDQQGYHVAALFTDAGFDTHIRKDQYGLVRVAVAQWKSNGYKSHSGS